MHVTMKLRRGLRKLRGKATYRLLHGIFLVAAERRGFRICEFSIQNDHLHLIVEADDRESLSRGIQGLAIRVARGLNRLWGRVGKVWKERFHERVLRGMLEVKDAIAYVLNNARKHGVHPRGRKVDPFSSGVWFERWQESYGPLEAAPAGYANPIVRPRGVLLDGGWTLHGRISCSHVPGRRHRWAG